MIRPPQGQPSFHDLLWEHLLPQDHELYRIRKSFDFSWVEQELGRYYEDSTEGRPAFSPMTLFLMHVLEFYDGLSDYEVVDQTRYNALYRYFVGVSLEEPVPDHSTLSFFRKRIGEDGFRRVFEGFVAQLKGQGLVSHRLKVVDATHMQANARILSRLGILRQAQRRLRAKMKQENPALAERLLGPSPATPSRTAREQEEKDPQVLAEEVQRLQELLALAKGTFERGAWQEAQAIEDLLFDSHDRIASLTDPEARFGYKSKDKHFCGYKLHTITNESEIVTTVETLPGNHMESQDLARLLHEESQRGLDGEVVVADALYDSGPTRRAIREELKMQEVIPWDRKVVQAEFFSYDPHSQTLSCPPGHNARGGSPHCDGKLFYFSKSDCQSCPMQDLCPSFSKREGRARVLLSLDRELRLQSAISQDTGKGLFRYRTIVERVYGKAKLWHGLGRARYRGQRRIAIQAFLTFFVLNAKKASRILEGLCPLKPPGLAAWGYG